MIGTLGRIGIGMMAFGMLLQAAERLINAYHVWQFNRTASTRDPRKVDQNWNWRE